MAVNGGVVQDPRRRRLLLLGGNLGRQRGKTCEDRRAADEEGSPVHVLGFTVRAETHRNSSCPTTILR